MTSTTKRPSPSDLAEGAAVAVVVPCYNVAAEIAAVVAQVPSWVRWIVLVNDASRDDTAAVLARLAQRDPRVQVLTHKENRGVGGAMATGFAYVLNSGAQYIVKLDGDGQMDPAAIPHLLRPLLLGKADYAKGNRFRDVTALRRMPLPRQLGNLALSFMVKVACGYWRVFDPTNGFIALRSEVLAALKLERLDPSYFFEIDMLHHMALLGAVVRDVALPARYGNEVSHLSIRRILVQFPPKLLRITLRRLVLRKLSYDFAPEGLYLLLGTALLAFGVIFGGTEWAHYGALGVPAPGGTVILPVVGLILGAQLLLAAVALDIQAEPREPISEELAPLAQTAKAAVREAS